MTEYVDSLRVMVRLSVSDNMCLSVSLHFKCMNGKVINGFDVWIISACFLSKYLSGYNTLV